MQEENEEMLVTQIKNIYIMLLSAIVNENIEKADHFLDDKLTEKYRKIIETNQKNNVQQKYDQMNITNVEIKQNDKNFLVANALVRVLDYKKDKKTGAIVCGDNNVRTKRNVVLKFRKGAGEKKAAYKCPNCGAPLNLNSKSFCDYCGRAVDERFSGLILYEIY